MQTNSTTTAAALDLAADSPLSYAELRELNAARQLAPRLALMTPRERIGAAALVAEQTGRDVSSVLARFARLVEEAAAAAQAEGAEPAAFTPIARAAIFDELVAAADYARSVAPAGPWRNAVTTAWGHILEADTLSYDPFARALRVESASEAGRYYVSGAGCSCRAAELGRPCWHRCAARLVARALELRARAAELAEGQGVSYARALPAASAALGFPIYAARPLAA